MDKNELAKIKAITEMATDGPWTHDLRVGCVAVYPSSETHRCLDGIERSLIYYKHGTHTEGEGWSVDPVHNANAEFIAMARTAIPALVEEVEKLHLALEAIGIEVKLITGE